MISTAQAPNYNLLLRQKKYQGFMNHFNNKNNDSSLLFTHKNANLLVTQNATHTNTVATSNNAATITDAAASALRHERNYSYIEAMKDDNYELENSNINTNISTVQHSSNKTKFIRQQQQQATIKEEQIVSSPPPQVSSSTSSSTSSTHTLTATTNHTSQIKSLKQLKQKSHHKSTHLNTKSTNNTLTTKDTLLTKSPSQSSILNLFKIHFQSPFLSKKKLNRSKSKDTHTNLISDKTQFLSKELTSKSSNTLITSSKTPSPQLHNKKTLFSLGKQQQQQQHELPQASIKLSLKDKDEEEEEEKENFSTNNLLQLSASSSSINNHSPQISISKLKPQLTNINNNNNNNNNNNMILNRSTNTHSSSSPRQLSYLHLACIVNGYETKLDATRMKPLQEIHDDKNSTNKTPSKDTFYSNDVSNTSSTSSKSTASYGLSSPFILNPLDNLERYFDLKPVSPIKKPNTVGIINKSTNQTNSNKMIHDLNAKLTTLSTSNQTKIISQHHDEQIAKSNNFTNNKENQIDIDPNPKQQQQHLQEKEEMTTSIHKIIKDGNYYMNEMQKLIDHFSQLKQIYETIDLSSIENDSQTHNEVTGRINTTLGSLKLFVFDKKTSRFDQFKSLCEQNLGILEITNKKQIEIKDKVVTNEDLAGFWDLMSAQIEDTHKSFNELELLRENKWNLNALSSKQQEIKSSKTIGTSSQTPFKKTSTKKVPTSTTKIVDPLNIEQKAARVEASRKRLLEAKRAAMLKLKQQDLSSSSNTTDDDVLIYESSSDNNNLTLNKRDTIL